MTSAARSSVWNPSWSWRGWCWVLTLGLTAGIAVAFWSSAPWWAALILGVAVPAFCYTTTVQRNVEWRGYQRCPTCDGLGKVKTDG